MSIVQEKTQLQKDMLAQWAFDCRPILGRFHIWLESVETEWSRGRPEPNQPRDMSFVPGGLERQLAMTCALTALGTRLFGRFGEGKGLDKVGINEVKKDADAVSAYAMSEGLWYLTRHLPENHALMICLGEGLMPKAGETEEMGSNPNLGFGRVYARPEVARFVDQRVIDLLNKPGYGWDEFYRDIRHKGITLWGAAVDTLENTSRFAKGAEEGTMTILHVFDQPLHVVRPYEGYMGCLTLPRAVQDKAAEKAVLLDYRTPRELVMKSIQQAYPGIKAENVHVWTLGGKSRVTRLSGLWETWRSLGAHLVEEGWKLPNGGEIFIESGTYSPTLAVGTWQDDQGETHLFLCDGYAASAEALQAASLAPIHDLHISLSVFTSKFSLPHDREQKIMGLVPQAADFAERLERLMGSAPDEQTCDFYREMIAEADDAGINLEKPTLVADDFFPEKKWGVLALGSYMGFDPYTATEGVVKVAEDTYRVTVRLTSRAVEKKVSLTVRLMEGKKPSRSIFQPLLSRFLAGENYRERAVKISDSGRIRNELQTLCSEALEFPAQDRMRVVFERIPETIFSSEKKERLKELLVWYRERHPVWFDWLELC
ncbi:MAG: hypothetical protein WC314_02135 [Vulcanimicrobiota bacterium]